MARAILIFTLLALPLVAQAESPVVAILPPKVESGVRSDVARALVVALEGELKRQGFAVRAVREPKSPALQDLMPCIELDCGRRAELLLDVDFLVASTVFHMQAEDSLSVTVVAPDGNAYGGNATLGSTPVERAALQALTRALQAQRRGPGPWLQVRGEPSGAHVLINGKPVGELPRALVHVTNGLNHVVVQAPGYQEYDHAQDIAADIDELIDLEVRLEERTGSSAAASAHASGADTRALHLPETTARRTASTTDYAVGGALVLAGSILALVDPLATANRSGKCANRACTEVYGFSARVDAEVIAGALLVAAGPVVAFVWKPFGTDVRVGVGTIAVGRKF